MSLPDCIARRCSAVVTRQDEHQRGMLGQPGRRYAPYLAKLWRPESGVGVRSP